MLQADNTSVAMSACPCIAALLIGLVINAEHRRSLRSSALPGIYLLVAILSDLAKIKEYLCRENMRITICLAIVTASTKFTLLFLLESSKRSHLPGSERHDSSNGEEMPSGLWNQTFLAWLNRTMSLGFRNALTVNDLEPLGPQFSSARLSNALKRSLIDCMYPLFAQGSMHRD